MASYNRVIMMGNLTRDPDHRQLASGQSVCRLSLASNRQFKNRQTGTLIQEVCFVDIDVWGVQGDSCAQYLKKGGGILVEGRLKFDSWQDNDGQKRSKHFIVADRVTFLPSSSSVQTGEFSQTLSNNVDNKSENVSKDFSSNNNQESLSQDGQKPSTGEINFKDKPPFEDDLPF
ncbi:single-stranded DNA-binding protein [Candidatus Babeliales bacterium]|nr:single-stranded DNA-binding protein [Candidatus Babeliales bacterium]